MKKMSSIEGKLTLSMLRNIELTLVFQTIKVSYHTNNTCMCISKNLLSTIPFLAQSKALLKNVTKGFNYQYQFQACLEI